MNIPNKKYCHSCGKETLIGSRFCGACGTKLDSLDEKPPGLQPKGPLPRVHPQPRETFEPAVLGARGGRRQDDDDDDSQIRADRVDSLAELGISMNELSIDIDSPRVQRESFANVVKSGLGFPAGYQEPARAVGDVSKDAAINVMREGAALRPGTSTEIK
jgi:hypothetical protein